MTISLQVLALARGSIGLPAQKAPCAHCLHTQRPTETHKHSHRLLRSLPLNCEPPPFQPTGAQTERKHIATQKCSMASSSSAPAVSTPPASTPPSPFATPSVSMHPASTPPASSPPSPFGLRFLIKILVLLFFLGVGVDHRDQKQQERHARKRQEQQEQHQQQEEGQNATALVVQAAINATAATNATATPDGDDLLDDGAVSLPLDSPWIPTLGGLLLYKWIDWQLFDPLAPSLQDCVAYLRGAVMALHWPEAETALAGTAMVTGSAYLAYQEKTRLDSLAGCWAHLQTTWWAEGLRAANAARHTGPCESPSSPASAPAICGNDLPACNKDEIEPVLPSSANIEDQSTEQPSGNPLDNEERTTMPTSTDPSTAWHRRYESKFWRLLGRGGHYYGTALKFLAKAWLPPAAQDWLGVMEGDLKDWLGDSKEKLGIKLIELEQKLGRWSSRALMGGGVSIPFVYYVTHMARRLLVGIEGACVRVRTYARNRKIVQGKEGEAGWCEDIKSSGHMYRMYMGPWVLHLRSIIAVLVEWWVRGFRRRREQMRQAQPAAEEAGVSAQEKETKTERLPGGAGRMRLFSFARRSTEADQAIEEGVAAAAARAQEEEQEQQQLQEEEILRGKRQHALLKILRTMAAQRCAADAVAMVDIYTKSWQLLRRLYDLERDESKPWSVREKELKHLWLIFDAHWEALTTWTDGWVPRELSLLTPDASIEGAQLARLYARLARAVHTDTNYMWPRPSATRQDVKQKTQWSECADLAALRPHILARYWRECGFARQQMWKQGMWAVMMSHPHIRASVIPRKQHWKPRLRRRQLEHQQVPLWRSGPGQPDVQLLHPIELRALDVQEAAPGTGLETQVTLFSVDVRQEGMLSPSKRPYLLQGWLDGPTKAKLVMAAMVPVRAAEQRRLLEVEPGIGTQQRRLRARLRALVLAFLTSHEMDTLETAAALMTSLTTSMAGSWERLLLSHQAMPPAVVLEQARRHRAGEGVAEHKQHEGATATAPVLWPNVLELRLDLHRRPPSLDVIARHSHLAALIMVRQQFPSHKVVEATGRGTRESKSASATAQGKGGGQAIGSVADEGMRGDKKGGSAGGGAKAFTSAPEPFVVWRTTPIVEALPVAARDVAAMRATLPKPTSVPMSTRTSPPPPLPHLQCAAPCPPTHPGPLVAPQQRAVPPGRQVGWIRPPPRGRGVLAGLRYLLYLVAMYGIPAFVFTVWAWYLYTQWVEEIVAQERATAARLAAAARAETPTIDDVIRSLPAMGGIKVARMDWCTAKWPVDEDG